MNNKDILDKILTLEQKAGHDYDEALLSLQGAQQHAEDAIAELVEQARLQAKEEASALLAKADEMRGLRLQAAKRATPEPECAQLEERLTRAT